MRQTKLHSLIESIANTVSGFALSAVLQLIINHMYHLNLSVGQSLSIVLWFTLLSVARNYIIRRWFNHMGERIHMWFKNFYNKNNNKGI